MLRFPRDGLYAWRDAFVALTNLPAHRRTESITPRRFDENPSDMSVACPRDAPALFRLTARVLRGHESQIGHQCWRRRKSREVCNLGSENNRGENLHSTQGLKRLDQRSQAPALDEIDDVLR